MTEAKKKESLFEQLSKINVSDHLENKGNMNLKYLSWVWAWQKIKEIDPDAKREYTKFKEYDFKTGQLTGRDVDYCKTDTGTYVECTLTIKGQSETETLYVMDFKNKAVLEPTQDQINKAKQRCFVKAAALHGLGLYVYAGEDLPEREHNQAKPKPQPTLASDKDRNELISEIKSLSLLNNQDNKTNLKRLMDNLKIKNWEKMSASQAVDMKNLIKAESTKLMDTSNALDLEEVK
ncbi:DUF1071 domain-containing protein [Lentilactobacillus sp. SPB1-3]|uniref:DUF1071 domain-containing protein n=1 Tax=Lentilactobacillus terminaliae TaxID=3003483 RepID=A0ACD5DDM0_9LACO|nr:DUF1071 domain-containing protein [Lentilactobacillus sp. SPB1-3]MCZ0978057.1 DUF1071 domain-containing protein [Lentilactobacillus sp. SPB1-3]